MMSILALIVQSQTTYCERSGPGPFDEPINVISSLAFAIAAVLAAGRMQGLPGLSRGARLLPWSLAMVSIGSTLYHTYRSPLTFLGDVIPLVVFIAGSIYLVLRKVLDGTAEIVLVSTGFVGFQIILLNLVPSDFLNGSTPHLINLLFISPIMALTIQRYDSLVLNVVAIGVFYALAFVFRTVDLSMCPWLPLGTHFLWHIAGAAAGFFVIRLVFVIEVND